MKIAIFSDVHKRVDLFRDALEFLVKRGAGLIIIAGDVVMTEALILAKESAIETKIVFGNNDAHLSCVADEFDLRCEPYYFNYGGASFKLSHMPFYMNPDADVIIFGHTHIRAAQKAPAALYLNPGEICAREKNLTECMELEILKDKFITRAFFREPGANEWSEEYFEFER